MTKKYMITSRQQSIVQNQNIVIENLSFEKVEKFKYLEVATTNTYDIRKEMKLIMSILLFTSQNFIVCLLSKKLKVNTYKKFYYQLYCMVVKLGLSP